MSLSFIRSDNGPEFICKSLREFLGFIEVGASYIELARRWQNGFVESFHGRLRDQCLACELFFGLYKARAVIGRWRQMYNHRRPHSELGGLTPAEFVLGIKDWVSTRIAFFKSSRKL
ncbi:integrase core domain-containing protein [Rubripirellula reticaptiva]|uniref:integrase core domain-containing protein n=1 Tax=Rubripirellula reticaptiva TaxID=2528013 RepID=UPI0011B80E83|nr:integrase core domain-containing protein [Rubripirellula reticaptiva]